jgi:hypothetical protein
MASLVATLVAIWAGQAVAADGFKLRFPLTGTLGGEMVAPLNNGGLYGQLAVTQFDIDKVTGNDGNTFTQTTTGTASGTTINAAVQASATATAQQKALAPLLVGKSASYTGVANLDLKQTQTQTNAIIGYLTNEEYSGGRLTVAVNIPYVTFNRTANLTGTTPTLSTFTPAIAGTPQQVAGAQAVGQGAFASSYQAGLASQSTSGTGSAAALGDIEVSGAWVYSDEKKKIIAGATLAMPTGEYKSTSTLNVGFGNYYTLRPGVAVAYKTTDALTLGARTSLGINSPNTDNGIRTGNFYAIDLAAAYMTPIGVVGPHVIQLAQYEDDQGGTLGANRLSATGAGFFFATLIKPIGAGLNISYMQMLESRNSLSGSFIQVRLTKAF